MAGQLRMSQLAPHPRSTLLTEFLFLPDLCGQGRHAPWILRPRVATHCGLPRPVQAACPACRATALRRTRDGSTGPPAPSSQGGNLFSAQGYLDI